MDSYAEEQFNEHDQPSNSGLLRFRSAPSPAPLLSSFKPQSPPVVDSPPNQLPPFRVDASNSTPPMDGKLGGCLLTGQTSSPAAFFSNLTSINDGYGMMGGGGSFRLASSSASGEDHSNRMKAHVNLGTSIGHLPRIPEIGAKTTNDSGSDDGGGTPSHRYTSAEEDPRFHSHGYSWNDNTSGIKRHQQDNRILYSGLDTSASQNGMLPHRTHILSHHLSLPKTSAEMAAVEKLLNFQETVPCKIRAKRGYATHPRSIAERVRRTRISERMKQLQDLVPNMEKQVNTSEMLDLAVDYIKELQKQYKTLSDNRARCKCLPVQQ